MERQRLDIWNDLLSHRKRFLFVRGDVSELNCVLNFAAMTKLELWTVRRGKSTLKLHIRRKGNGQTFCDVSRCSVWGALTVMKDSLNPRCRVRKTLSCDCRDSLLLYLQKSLSPQQASFAGLQKTKLCRQAAHIIFQTGKVLTADHEGRIVCSEIWL